MKIYFEKEDKMINNVIFLENIDGYSLRIFHGLLLFGRLLSFFVDKFFRAMLIWGATTIRHVRVSIFLIIIMKLKSNANFLS